MVNITKKILLTVQDQLHKNIKLKAAKEELSMHDYCIKVLSEAVSK